jgi:hypothetical protein
LSSFILIDEDFFLYKKRALEFLQCVREGGKPLSLMGFGSVRGLSQFNADEIAEMGFDTIWTAFEGAEAGYGKLQGEPLEKLYAALRSRGVSLLSSMIIGFPYQDSQRVRQEFDRLMDLRPSLTQILIYFAFPGTPFHQQVLSEERYLPQYRRNPDLRRWDGFSMHFAHPKFSAPELEALQRELYRQDFERLGPSIVRILRVWLEGYRNLRGSEKPLLKARAQAKLATIRSALPAIVPAILFGPNRKTRAEAGRLLREIRNEIGGLTMVEWFLCLTSPILAVWTGLANRLRLFQQPALLRVEHRSAGHARGESPVVRLQGGFHANVIRVLAEDAGQNARDLWSRFFRETRPEDVFSTDAVTRLPLDKDSRQGGADPPRIG